LLARHTHTHTHTSKGVLDEVEKPGICVGGVREDVNSGGNHEGTVREEEEEHRQ